MSPRAAFAALFVALAVGSVVGCSGSGDDGCPGCEEGMGGSVTFPPPTPTTGGLEPSGGATATGGFSGDSAGGQGGVSTGGLGGVLAGLGGTGALGAEGGTAGTGAFGAEGGTAGTGAFGAEGGTLAGGAFGTGGFGGTL
jgi:hypothetical protein